MRRARAALLAAAVLAACATAAAADTSLSPVPVFFSSSPSCSTACDRGETSCPAPGHPTCCNVLCRGGTLGTPTKAPPGGSAAAPLFVNGVVTQTDAASLAALKAYGAQSIRTYTAVGGPAVLALAQTAGLTVTMGLAIPTAAGNAATYTSTAAATTLLASLQPLITACMSYPNLLFWFVGNEVEDPPNQGYGPIFAFMNTVCDYIHAVDPYHPCGTATPDITAATLYGLNTYAPKLDLLGSNVYGPALASNPGYGANSATTAVNGLSVSLPPYGAGGAVVLPTYTNAIQGGCCNGNDATCAVAGLFDDSGKPISTAVANASCIWTRPYLISELGPTNWWEVTQTPWGDWMEFTSTQKALQYLQNWQVATAMASTAYTNIPAWMNGAAASGYAGGAGLMGGLCVGAYAFSYGWVWQASATWINVKQAYPYSSDPAFQGHMVGGEEIEPIDTLAYLWTGKLPAQRAPTITRPLSINNMTADMNIALQIGKTAVATIGASDPNGDALTYTWLAIPLPNAPTNHTTYAALPFAIVSSAPGRISFTPPATPGYYRLLCYAADGKGKAATHSVPFEAVLTAAPVSAYAADDGFVTDGARLVAGWDATVTQTSASLPYLSLLAGYQPGINTYPYISVTVPASWPRGVVPDAVTLSVHVQGGAPITSLSTVSAYSTPTGWSSATLSMANAPCTTGYSASAAVRTVATSVFSGTCTLAGTWANPTPGSWQPAGVASPPGLQMNGQYIAVDVTKAFTAAVMATAVPGVTRFSFMLSMTGATGRTTFLSSLESDPTGNKERAPYVTFTPPAAASKVSATLALSGTTALSAANQASMRAAIAATMPGVSATAVDLTVVGGQVTVSVSLTAAQAALFTPAAQAAYGTALAADIAVDPSTVVVSTAPLAGRRRGARRAALQAAAGSGPLEIPITIHGFPPANPVTGAASPAATAAAKAVASALLDPSSNASAALAAHGCPPAALSLAEPPAVWHQLSFGVPVAATTATPTPPAPAAPPLPPAYAPASPLSPFRPPAPPTPPPSAPGAPHAGYITPTWRRRAARALQQAATPGGSAPTMDPATASSLLHNNADSGALASAMATQGVSPAPDTATAGRFARVSPLNRANNPFEELRGTRHGNAPAPPTPPPAPGTIVVQLQGIGANSASVQLLIIVAVVSIFVAVTAACAAFSAVVYVVSGGGGASDEEEPKRRGSKKGGASSSRGRGGAGNDDVPSASESGASSQRERRRKAAK